jgi:preprotein translocase subunit YajC
MQFLLSHWHCILPVVGIGIAFIFMRDKPKNKKTDETKNQAVIPQQNND